MNWIFQGNPDYFDIDEYLSIYPNLIYWRTPIYQERIQLGHLAFIWRAKEDAGVIAVGRIAEPPIERSKVKYSEALNDNLWHGQTPDPDEKAVGIELSDVRLTNEEGMISRAELKEDPVIGENAIIKAPQGTVFHLTSEQAERLIFRWSMEPLKQSKEDEEVFVEGAVSFKFHRRRERSTVLRKRKLEIFWEYHGRLFCEMCGLDPAERYSRELAESVIEVHHTKPLSFANSPHPTKLEDLLVVCANCHRAIHSSMGKSHNIPIVNRIFISNGGANSNMETDEAGAS